MNKLSVGSIKNNEDTMFFIFTFTFSFFSALPFFMSIQVSTLYYFPSPPKISLSVSCKAHLLATNFLIFCSPEKDFVYSSLLRLISQGTDFWVGDHLELPCQPMSSVEGVMHLKLIIAIPAALTGCRFTPGCI